MVEGNSLENCQAGNGLVGSNPTLSARRKILTEMWVFSFVDGSWTATSIYSIMRMMISRGF